MAERTDEYRSSCHCCTDSIDRCQNEKIYAMNKESQIQIESVRAFNMIYPEYRGLLFSVPNGGSRNRLEAVRLKREGIVAGVSDLLFLVPRGKYHGLCIEMKNEENIITSAGNIVKKRTYQSQEQREWQDKVQRQGYKYIICRSCGEFLKELGTYLNEKEEG